MPTSIRTARGIRSTTWNVGYAMTRAPTSLPAHTRLGNYELVRLLAQGGMADIYLARAREGQLCAIKVMTPGRAGDAEACTQFMDEARVLAMLDHANLAGVYEVAKEGHCYYLALEFVHGADLREMLAAAERAATAKPYATAVAIVAAAAAGLDHAHRRCSPDGRPLRLVHRDVSLSNIMVAHGGSVKVIDWGIACAAVSEHHTNPGVVRGKASYMSPEQARGEEVDLRTDVFALGVVLYELTTGRRCFSGASDFERMLAVVRGEFVAPSAIVPGFPAALERVIKTALAVDKKKRYASAAALLEAPDVAQATGIITRPRRLARGTESDVSDDQPTRGRRSLPAIFAPRVAA